MERYYLSQTTDGAWKITKQQLIEAGWIDPNSNLSETHDSWVDTETQEFYQTWEEANDQPLSPLCYDPQPDWPEELGGQE